MHLRPYQRELIEVELVPIPKGNFSVGKTASYQTETHPEGGPPGLSARWEVGWGDIPVTEWEADVAWDRYVNRFLTLFAGGNFLGADDEIEDSRAVVGLQYLLPLSIAWRSWIASDGTARTAFEKELMLLPRVGIAGEAEYDTDLQWEGSVAAAYIINQPVSLAVRWHSEFGWGGGVVLRL